MYGVAPNGSIGQTITLKISGFMTTLPNFNMYEWRAVKMRNLTSIIPYQLNDDLPASLLISNAAIHPYWTVQLLWHYFVFYSWRTCPDQGITHHHQPWAQVVLWWFTFSQKNLYRLERAKERIGLTAYAQISDEASRDYTRLRTKLNVLIIHSCIYSGSS